MHKILIASLVFFGASLLVLQIFSSLPLANVNASSHSINITAPLSGSWHNTNFSVDYTTSSADFCIISTNNNGAGWVEQTTIKNCVSSSIEIDVATWCPTEGQDKCEVKIAVAPLILKNKIFGDNPGELGVANTWTVPAGVNEITVDVKGAAGGAGSNSNGGLGGRVQTTVSVTPKETLHVYIGGKGEDTPPAFIGAPSGGGFNGGGNSGDYHPGGGAGGGGSDIRRGGSDYGNRIVVAGGGGGGGERICSSNSKGGHGGHNDSFTANGQDGGSGATTNTTTNNGGAGGGTPDAMVVFKGADTISIGSAGTLAPGAGGGGWYGGNAGGIGTNDDEHGCDIDFGSGGGGGGSNYVESSVEIGPTTHERGVQSGNGLVEITWREPDLDDIVETGQAFSIDFTNPTVQITDPPTTELYTGNFEVTYECADALSGIKSNGCWIEVKDASGNWQKRGETNDTGQVEIDVNSWCSNDLCEIQVSGEDNAGNKHSITAIYNAQPFVRIEDSTDWYNADFTIQYTAKSVDTCEIFADGALQTTISNCKSGTATIQVPVGGCSTEGENACAVKIIGKKIGIPNVEFEEFFNIDLTAPTISNFTVTDGVTSADPASGPLVAAVRGLTFNWDASDNLGGSGLRTQEVWQATYITGICDESNKSGCSWVRLYSGAASGATDNPLYGEYWYSIRAIDQASPSGNCITAEGTHCGGVPSDGTVRSSAGPIWVQVPVIGGLVPCGRKLDAIDTPWNEEEDCEFRHTFLLLHNVINFTLWKLAPLIIVVMVVLTGVIMYYQLGSVNTLVLVKRIWRYVGIGVLTLLFSWLFLNFFLGILGFDITIFGRWYSLTLET